MRCEPVHCLCEFPLWFPAIVKGSLDGITSVLRTGWIAKAKAVTSQSSQQKAHQHNKNANKKNKSGLNKNPSRTKTPAKQNHQHWKNATYPHKIFGAPSTETDTTKWSTQQTCQIKIPAQRHQHSDHQRNKNIEQHGRKCNDNVLLSVWWRTVCRGGGKNEGGNQRIGFFIPCLFFLSTCMILSAAGGLLDVCVPFVWKVFLFNKTLEISSCCDWDRIGFQVWEILQKMSLLRAEICGESDHTTGEWKALLWFQTANHLSTSAGKGPWRVWRKTASLNDDLA